MVVLNQTAITINMVVLNDTVITINIVDMAVLIHTGIMINMVVLNDTIITINMVVLRVKNSNNSNIIPNYGQYHYHKYTLTQSFFVFLPSSLYACFAGALLSKIDSKSPKCRKY
jgi:hypothetical protein